MWSKCNAKILPEGSISHAATNGNLELGKQPTTTVEHKLRLICLKRRQLTQSTVTN